MSGDAVPTGESGAACAVAHGSDAGRPGTEAETRTLVAVFASPVADCLLRYGADLGYRTVLLDPRPEDSGPSAAAVRVSSVAELTEHGADPLTDVVVTDHHRAELATLLRDLLTRPVRWIGVLGNPRHPAPYLDGLSELGVTEPELARIHRPIGLNIGSRTPPEIAIATLGGLLADRNGRPGGLEF